MSALKNMDTVELRGRLNEINAKMHEVLEQAGDNVDMTKVTAIAGDSAAIVDQLRSWNAEASDLGTELDERQEIAGFGDRIKKQQTVQPHPGHATSGRDEAKQQAKEPQTLGELFVNTPDFKAWAPGMSVGSGSEIGYADTVATLFETGAGWAPQSVRSGKVFEFPRYELLVADLLQQIPVNSSTYEYWTQNSVSNAAVEVTEGSAKPEAALAMTLRTEYIRKIAVYLPVTDEQLDDVPAARAFVDSQLGDMVKRRLDLQILVGNGVAPNLAGITDDSRTGLQTQAKGSDPTLDAIYKALQKVRVVGNAEPNAVVLHPNDFTPIRLLSTADGIYIWGSPSEAGPERIWGKRLVQTSAMTENTGLVGDFDRAALLLRQGLTLKVGYVNDDLIKNRQTIVAELRAGVAVFQESAFCTVTSI